MKMTLFLVTFQDCSFSLSSSSSSPLLACFIISLCLGVCNFTFDFVITCTFSIIIFC